MTFILALLALAALWFALPLVIAPVAALACLLGAVQVPRTRRIVPTDGALAPAAGHGAALATAHH